MGPVAILLRRNTSSSAELLALMVDCQDKPMIDFAVRLRFYGLEPDTE